MTTPTRDAAPGSPPLRGRTVPRAAVLVALSLLLYLGLACNPVNWWITDLATGLGSSHVDGARATAVVPDR